ncbi:MAG: hypothetical protein ACO1SX_20845 [Actinomycetota bacterium]
MQVKVETWEAAAGKGIDDVLNGGVEPRIEEVPVELRDPATCAPRKTNRPSPLGEPAYYGLAGETVRQIDPHTEADQAAVLLQLLVLIGNAIGRGAHFVVSADRHFANEYLAIVGPTCVGAKGSSLGPPRWMLGLADREWEYRIASGLSSGEGLIEHVRDPIEKRQAVREKGRVVDYETVIEDHGVSDKRLVAIETELARALKVMDREGNTLSPVLRDAWDGNTLQVLTRSRPVKATGAHISVIGHITPTELRSQLGTNDSFNGFANRFLWGWSVRSKLLPDGGAFGSIDSASLIRRFEAALDFGKVDRELRRDPESTRMWEVVYPRLTSPRPGLFGAVTARAAPHVMRIALIYAVLDCSALIRPEHLSAALEVWMYCEQSARFIFGDSTGDRLADRLLDIISTTVKGATRSELSAALGRNVDKHRINAALELLEEAGLVCRELCPTPGRSAERWRRIC